MSAIPAAQGEKSMGLLLDDPNLEFNFGQVFIDNPSVLSTRAKFYRSRDHIASWDDDALSRREPRRAAERVRGEAAETTDEEEGRPEERPEGAPAPEYAEGPGPSTGEDGRDESLRLPSEEISFD